MTTFPFLIKLMTCLVNRYCLSFHMFLLRLLPPSLTSSGCESDKNCSTSSNRFDWSDELVFAHEEHLTETAEDVSLLRRTRGILPPPFQPASNIVPTTWSS